MSKIKLIPISEKKIPLVEDWQTSTEEFKLNGYGVGMVCGKLSGGVEGIDVDCKYDLTGKLWSRLKSAINEADPTILPKMTVQETVSGGYHMIYTCSKIEGNKKLAQRPASNEEVAKGDKVKVLIETRGEGGYFAIAPTKGYKVTFGDLNNLQEITPEQRETLMDVCRSFNKLIKEAKKPTSRQIREIGDITPFDDYNEKADVVGLLVSHGWSVIKEKGHKTLMKRPGTTSAATSGNWDEDKRWFSVFSTSTEFEAQKAYQPYGVYAVLECGGDWNLAAKKLYDAGYGNRKESDKPRKQKEFVEAKITKETPLHEFVSSKKDRAGYLQMVADGTLPMGKTTGVPELDLHWLFKAATFVIINGHDNVGKSVVIWFIMMLGALFHGLKSIIYTGENSDGFVVRKLSEFYWGEKYEGMPKAKRDEAEAFIDEHFTIIKNREELYNYRDVIEMFRAINGANKHDMAMIDPYNSLDVPVGVNEHSFHYKAVNELKQFGAANNLSIFINCHAVTGALRQLDGDGHVRPPMKADTEGGGKFSNKADDFWTIHRLVDHPDEWMVTDIYIRKVKETETGGKPTTKGSPVRLRAKIDVVGFETFITGFDPVKHWHDVMAGNFYFKNNPSTGKQELVIPEWLVNYPEVYAKALKAKERREKSGTPPNTAKHTTAIKPDNSFDLSEEDEEEIDFDQLKF